MGGGTPGTPGTPQTTKVGAEHDDPALLRRLALEALTTFAEADARAAFLEHEGGYRRAEAELLAAQERRLPNWGGLLWATMASVCADPELRARFQALRSQRGDDGAALAELAAEVGAGDGG
ncbi:MAG: hypothetical protein EA356_13460 [Geminicoccaceae bacterium]|nr:MAG: hypothetical protein EA356_13460 [Geminicoccaceae bacterium]